jgi:large subunit ribosomal protein L13
LTGVLCAGMIPRFHARKLDFGNEKKRAMSDTGLQQSFMGTPATVERKWFVVDASGQILGRLAVRIARILQGKNKPQYTPHADLGDFVVVVNAHKIKVTGDKLDTKEYQFYSGYPHGQKRKTLRHMLDKRPEEVLRLAVRRMLPKSKLGRKMLLKMKVHKDMPTHGYTAQKLTPLADVAPLAGARA